MKRAPGILPVRVTKVSRGQAMVEFVILLTIIMVMVSGMLYFFRLHLYQFWAQQEARYLAFEQTWVPAGYYASHGGQPDSLLQGQADTFKRPGVVSGLTAQRNTSNFGGMSDLIPGLFGRLEDATPVEEAPPSFLGFGESAYAAQRTVSWEDNNPRQKSFEVPPSPLPKLDQALEHQLHIGGFGETYCTKARVILTNAGVRPNTTQFGALDCPQKQEHILAAYLARETNIQNVFREIADRVEFGDVPGDAIEKTLERTVAEGFYASFKSEVQSKFGDAPNDLMIARASAAIDAANSSITRMISDLRYIGSTAAVLAVVAGGVAVGGENFHNTNSQTEFNFEKTVTDILHVDAANILPVIGDGYLLNPTYLPVPPKFGGAAAGFFSGPMTTVLSLDPGDVNTRINNSVKMVSITYDSAGGLFPAATRRFKTGAKLTANVVIDTDPWHIERRENHTGAYLDKGDQFDSTDTKTEEGLLRRGTMGMWMFPTPPSAFFDPITSFLGLGALNSVIDAFRPIESIISQIKNIMGGNNPMTQLVNAMSNIPIIGGMIPKFPVWPAVRPQAYPTSTEMGGDKLMGSDRNFQDYVTEQRNNNPDPNPTFN